MRKLTKFMGVKSTSQLYHMPKSHIIKKLNQADVPRSEVNRVMRTLAVRRVAGVKIEAGKKARAIKKARAKNPKRGTLRPIAPMKMPKNDFVETLKEAARRAGQL